MDTKTLDKLLESLSTQQKKDKENRHYFKGKNPHLLSEPRNKNPDNRISTPLAKMTVEDFVGYGARPGDIKLVFEPKEEGYEDDYPEIMSNIFEYNEDGLNTTELYEDALVYGRGAEAYWINPEVKISNTSLYMPEYKRVDCEDVVFIYTNEIKPQIEKAIRYYTYDEETYCEVYEIEKTTTYQRTKTEWKEIDNQETPFNYPAMIQYISNRDKEAIFEADKKLIDSHDNLISKSMNEIDRFNGMIMMLPQKVRKEIVDKLIEYKVIDDLEGIEADKWPKYLNKDLGGIDSFSNALADRIEKLYHKTSKDPDMSDDNFANNASGVAIAFKLIGFEFKASMIDSYFDKGIMRKIDMLNDAITAKNTSDITSVNADPYKYDVKIQHNRNMPIDIESKVRVAQLLTGIVSRETLLKWLPQDIVENAEKELEKIQLERESMPPLITLDDEGDNDAE